MGERRDQFSSALRSLSRHPIVTGVIAGLIVAAIVAAISGPAAMLDFLAGIPWFYVGVVLTATIGGFAGGMYVEIRAVERSNRLIHWLSKNAPKDEDMDRAEWALGFTRKYRPPDPNLFGPIVDGKVMSKRVFEDEHDGEQTGLLRIKESSTTSCWCVFDPNAKTFRKAREGEEVTIMAVPIGVVGHELFFLDVSDSESSD